MGRFSSLWDRLWKRIGSGPRSELETILGLQIRQLSLYEQALRHPSFEQPHKDNLLRSYERLEFLGDAVLGCVVAEHLYRAFPGKMEGFLTPLRSKLVDRKACARVARALDLGALVHLSPALESRGGRTNPSVLADCLEAIIGAIYLDRGMTAAKFFIHKHMIADVDLRRLAELEDNPKSLLLEYVQAKGWKHPTYKVVAKDGPPHDRIFTIATYVRGHQYGRGQAGSKKKAEQMAARQALSRLRREA